MARKNGLNRKEQIQAAKWMSEGISSKQVAKKFHTTPEVVERFTQEKLDKADEAHQERMDKQNRIVQKKSEQAAILTKAMELTGKDAANAEEFK